MDWFHDVGDMRWLTVFWVSSFLILWGLFYLFTRSERPPRATRRRDTSASPYDPTPHPRPSA